jgi:diaminopimelate epimerase
MQGLGNDFVVIDHPAFRPDSVNIQAIADRRLGVGCDQVLLLESLGGNRFRYRVFNADGSEAEQCGNGLRCLARYGYDLGIPEGTLLEFEGPGGVHRAQCLAPHRIRVDMGSPRLEPIEIPFVAPSRAPSYPIDVSGMEFTVGAVSMGNPHLLLRVQRLATTPVNKLGPALEHHPRCPQRTNVGFIEIVDRGTLRLRVHERGAGETLACGSGACAAVAWSRLMGWVDPAVSVHLSGGILEIEWEGENQPLYMTGPATRVFSGVLAL